MDKKIEWMRYCAQKNTEGIRSDLAGINQNLHTESNVASTLKPQFLEPYDETPPKKKGKKINNVYIHNNFGTINF